MGTLEGSHTLPRRCAAGRAGRLRTRLHLTMLEGVGYTPVVSSPAPGDLR